MTTMTRPRCPNAGCGRVMARHLSECRQCNRARNEARRAEARKIVATGKCPACGAALRRNLALAGWYQCSQFGAEQFRADSSKPSCSFQIFTE